MIFAGNEGLIPKILIPFFLVSVNDEVISVTRTTIATCFYDVALLHTDLGVSAEFIEEPSIYLECLPWKQT